MDLRLFAVVDVHEQEYIDYEDIYEPLKQILVWICCTAINILAYAYVSPTWYTLSYHVHNGCLFISFTC